MVELEDMLDLDSNDYFYRGGSSPSTYIICIIVLRNYTNYIYGLIKNCSILPNIGKKSRK